MIPCRVDRAHAAVESDQRIAGGKILIIVESAFMLHGSAHLVDESRANHRDPISQGPGRASEPGLHLLGVIVSGGCMVETCFRAAHLALRAAHAAFRAGISAFVAMRRRSM